MSQPNPTQDIRFAASDLIRFASQLFQAAGLAADRAEICAEILVEGDLMGHTTHGLSLLPAYLRDLDQDRMSKSGEPGMLADHGAAVTWDGYYLPGPWLVTQALDLAFERIQYYPVVTLSIRCAHHIASLASYPKRATDRGLFMLLLASDPNEKSVAPFGGIEPLYSPNPLAAGIPTEGDPIIIDISMSATANGYVARHIHEGRPMPGPWLLDNQGNATDDPRAVRTDPPGSLLPLGGMDLGYKGFALGLLLETMTAALAGYGRADAPGRWGTSVFLQVIDPDAFGGRENFVRQTQWLAEAARSNPTRPGDPRVRLPGSRGLQLRAEQMQLGVVLYPAILPGLQPWAEKLNVALPEPL